MINIWWIRGTFAVYSKNYIFLFQNIKKNKGLFLRTARDIVTWCFFSLGQKPAEICESCCKSSAIPSRSFLHLKIYEKSEGISWRWKAEGQIDLHLIEFKVRDHYSDHCFCALCWFDWGDLLLLGERGWKDPEAARSRYCSLLSSQSSQKCSR